MSAIIYTREQLNNLKVDGLKDICRTDRVKFYGFSSHSRRPLIEFILRKQAGIPGHLAGPGLSGNGKSALAGGASLSRGLYNKRLHPQVKEEDDYSDIFNEMFSVSNYAREYDDFEIDESNSIFDSYPNEEILGKEITKIGDTLKLYDKNSSLNFERFIDINRSEMYSLHKKQLYGKYGYLGDEMILLHATNKNNISEILENDFSLTINARHGIAYGKGLYFTNSIKKALEYSERGLKTKYVIITQVYIGDMVAGNMTMDIHPKLPNSNKIYDTSVDNILNPIQYIKKSNNQWNILGILEVKLSNPNIEKMKSSHLNCSLTIHNKTNEVLTIHFSFNKFSMSNQIQGKHMGIIKNGSLRVYNTAIGHNFACSNKYGCFRILTITKTKEYITIDKDYNIKNGDLPKWDCIKCKTKNDDDSTSCDNCNARRFPTPSTLPYYSKHISTMNSMGSHAPVIPSSHAPVIPSSHAPVIPSNPTGGASGL